MKAKAKNGLVLLIVCICIVCMGLFSSNAKAETICFPLPLGSVPYNANALARYESGSEHGSYLVAQILKNGDKYSNILVDIGAPQNTEIYAVADGTIYTNKWTNTGGWIVVIKHTDGNYSYYGHMNKQSDVPVGTWVSAGTRIGYVGKTGQASGYHLHFEWSGHDPYCTFQPMGYLVPKMAALKYPHNHGGGSDTTPAITFNNVYANSITETTAHVQADVTKNRALSKVGVKWGTTTAMTESPLEDSVGSVLTKIYYDFGKGGYPSLKKGTTYYYQFYAQDTSGNYYYSDQKSFKTSGTSGNNPQGCVDTIYGDMYSVWLSGWAFDMDSTRSQLDIAVFIDDVYAGSIPANVQRTDVNDAYPGVGLYHGFNYVVNTDKTGYHKVDVYAINVGEGDNTCLGTYYLTILKDEEAPVISDVRVTNRTSTGYTVTCTVTDNYYVDRVQFPTWSINNGQDDLFPNWDTNPNSAGRRDGNTYTYYVNNWDHNNDTGDYMTHIYAYDKENNYTCVPVGLVNIDATPPVISNVEVTDISPAGYTVRCTVTDNDAVDRVQFPTWTTENGQDDLVSDWSTNPAASGTYVGDNVYEFRVNASDHNNEVGIYRTHIYAWDACGNSSSVQHELPIINDIDTRTLLGDVNNDGKVNAIDRVVLRQYLMDKDAVTINTAAADVNQDGKINALDRVELRHMLMNAE